ncbi:MAG: hypothetical protein E6K98_00285 [Thaumarchaeota archaeon]|nr:MAG: hypothetical protein E6K98_00285 [Nitrososphaerota archaeon]
MLVAASLSEINKERIKIMADFFERNSISKDKDLKKSILTLLDVAPNFVSSLLKKYVESYSEGKITHLIPFDMDSVKKAFDETLMVQKELLEGFSSLSNVDREPIISFLKRVG